MIIKNIFSESIEVKNTDSKADNQACCSKTNSELICSGEENGYENSGDLFPDQSLSLEDYSTSGSGQSADLFPEYVKMENLSLILREKNIYIHIEIITALKQFI